MTDAKTPIEMMMDGVAWKATGMEPDPQNPEILFSTHEGILEIAGHTFRCYVLNNGQRVINEEDIEAFFNGRE